MRASFAVYLRWLAATSLVVACGGPKGPATETEKPVEKVAEPESVAEPEQPAEPEKVAEPDKPAEPEKPAEPAEPEPEYMHGNFVWFELSTKSPAKAADFYQKLFGWTSSQAEMGGQKMTLLNNGSRDIASIVSGKHAAWTSFISVPNVDESLLNVGANDGSVVTPATEVPEVGKFAIAKDPDGAVFALITEAKGDPMDGPAVNDFYWAELWSKQPGNAVNFYEAVVDYTSQEVTYGKDTSYRLIANKAPRGGIGKAKGSAQWIPCVLVEDVDATSKQAKKLKARVRAKPQVIFGIGRITVLSDPTGAYFGLIDTTDKGESK